MIRTALNEPFGEPQSFDVSGPAEVRGVSLALSPRADRLYFQMNQPNGTIGIGHSQRVLRAVR